MFLDIVVTNGHRIAHVASMLQSSDLPNQGQFQLIRCQTVGHAFVWIRHAHCNPGLCMIAPPSLTKDRTIPLVKFEE